MGTLPPNSASISKRNLATSLNSYGSQPAVGLSTKTFLTEAAVPTKSKLKVLPISRPEALSRGISSPLLPSGKSRTPALSKMLGKGKLNDQFSHGGQYPSSRNNNSRRPVMEQLLKHMGHPGKRSSTARKF